MYILYIYIMYINICIIYAHYMYILYINVATGEGNSRNKI